MIVQGFQRRRGRRALDIRAAVCRLDVDGPLYDLTQCSRRRVSTPCWPSLNRTSVARDVKCLPETGHPSRRRRTGRGAESEGGRWVLTGESRFDRPSPTMGVSSTGGNWTMRKMVEAGFAVSGTGLIASRRDLKSCNVGYKVAVGFGPGCRITGCQEDAFPCISWITQHLTSKRVTITLR